MKTCLLHPARGYRCSLLIPLCDGAKVGEDAGMSIKGVRYKGRKTYGRNRIKSRQGVERKK
jgi:hypothetical protein